MEVQKNTEGNRVNAIHNTKLYSMVFVFGMPLVCLFGTLERRVQGYIEVILYIKSK